MRIIGWISTALLLAGVTACGGNDETAVTAAEPVEVERTASGETNHAPVIRSVRLDPAEPIDGERIRAAVSVADQDGDPIEIEFEWRISGRLVSSGEDSIELKGVTKRDRIEVVVKASDGKLASEPARAEARVRNRRPNVVGVGVRPQPEVMHGQPLVATAQANDPDGDSLAYHYQWRVNGQLQMETSDTFETGDLDKGDEIQAFVIANDGLADSDDLASVVVRVANARPEIVSVPGANWTDDVFSYEVKARDPDNDVPLRYALATGPSGMRIDSVLGKLVWRAMPDQAGVHPVKVEVSDSAGATTVQSFEITVRTQGGESAAPPASAER